MNSCANGWGKKNGPLLQGQKGFTHLTELVAGPPYN